MERIPISVHVLTRNAGRTLKRALESVRACAEIIVVDGGSTDDTRAIAAQFGATILEEPRSEDGIPDFSAMRNAALDASAQNWIFVVDSDEYASEALMQEIAEIASGSAPGAYLVPRRYRNAAGERIERASTYPNERVFFFHRACVNRWIKSVHERIAVKPEIPLRRLLHPSEAPLPTVAEFRRKALRYLEIEIKHSAGRGWKDWFVRRLLHTLRSRLYVTGKLLWIWLTPGGRRLPLAHEWQRYWYAWHLIVQTMPSRRRNSVPQR